MLPLKRKRQAITKEDSDASEASSISDTEFLGTSSSAVSKPTPTSKASSSNTQPLGKRAKQTFDISPANSDQEAENEVAMIRELVVKRNIKDGKELMKKTAKAAAKTGGGAKKLETGGGSFQSMGESYENAFNVWY